jgi:hypothetical protein
LIELFTHFGCCDKLLFDSRSLKHLNSVLFQGFRSAAFGIELRIVLSNPLVFVGHWEKKVLTNIQPGEMGNSLSNGQGVIRMENWLSQANTRHFPG